jgi:hypothetical protein
MQITPKSAHPSGRHELEQLLSKCELSYSLKDQELGSGTLLPGSGKFRNKLKYSGRKDNLRQKIAAEL